MTRMDEQEQTIAAIKEKTMKFQEGKDKETKVPDASKNGALRKPTVTKWMLPMPSNEGRDAPLISPRFASTIISALQIECPRTELDSHADSPVVGDNARILRHMNKFVKVCGFSDKLGDLNRIPVVQAAVMYDCQYTGKEYVMPQRSEIQEI